MVGTLSSSCCTTLSLNVIIIQVLKNVDGALFRPLQLIYDWKLLQDSREIVFPVFARTVTYAGRVLRAPIIEELELPEYQRFNYERFGRGFLWERWVQQDHHAFDVCTAPADAPALIPRITITFEAYIAGHNPQAIEPLV